MRVNFLASRAASRALPAEFAEHINAVLMTTIQAFATSVERSAEHYRRTGIKPSKIRHGVTKNAR
jgi:hypothetical protein